MKGDLRFVVPALAGSGFIPPKGGTTNVSRRSMQYPGKRVRTGTSLTFRAGIFSFFTKNHSLEFWFGFTHPARS